jgi:hypothetical protein
MHGALLERIMVGDPHGPSTKSTLSAPPAHLDLPGLKEDILGLRAQNGVVDRSLRTGAQIGSDAGKTLAYKTMDATFMESVWQVLSEAA